VELLMWKPRLLALRLVAYLPLVLLGALAFSQSAEAQRALPEPAPLNNFNPLCDSSLVHCLEIDQFAGHVYGHLQVLPRTDRRDTAAVFPIGVTLGLFGRVAGGVSTYYAFWKEDDASYQQLGPLRLNLIGRLLPLFSSAGDAPDAPTRRFQLGVAYEHEVRVGPFSGANSLGLLLDLASFHLVGSKWLGPFQLSASVGALFDWKGAVATGYIAGQFGWLIPGFKQLKVFVGAAGRGFPVYAKKDAVPLTPDGQDPIRSQGIVSGGLAFRAHRRVDLGVEVQRGFGDGIAPWAIGINFLVISGGKEHEGRAVTPIAQLAADVTREFVTWAAEKIRTIDPYLKKDCVLYDEDHQPIRKLGELSPDERACIYQGLRVPIGPRFWHNKADTVLCYDEKLTDCFLTRSNRHDAWEPIHPLLVHDDCFAYHSGQPWMRIGKPSADKQSCENRGHVIPVGQQLRSDHSHPSYYCYDEPDKAKNQTKKQWCLERPEKPQTDGQYLGRRFAAGIDKAKDRFDRTGDRVHQVIDEGAQGVPLHATTPVQEAANTGRAAIDKMKNVTAEDAKRTFFDVLKAAKDWLNKPPREQLGDIAEEGGDLLTSPSTYIPGGTLLGKGSRIAVEGGEVAADAAKAGKKARKAAVRAAKAEDALAEHSIPAVRPIPKSEASLPSRRGAFRKAKRDAGIPQGQQPDAVVTPKMTDRWDNPILDAQGRPIKTREYEFTRPDGQKIVIQDHSAGHQFGQGGVGDQGPHFNVRPADRRRTGQVPGTQGHYSFQKRQTP
jgi:hypothetical protein